MRALNLYYSIVKTFGAVDGTYAFGVRAVSKMLPFRTTRVTKLSMRGFQHPIFIRPGTSDWSVLGQILIHREYECPSEAHRRALDRFYDDALSRSEVPLIIDCGANIGLTSIWYARAYPKARIIAIEPEPSNFQVLAMNTAQYQNILPVQAAISDRDRQMSLSNVGDAPWAWETRETDGGEVNARTVPDLLASIPNARLMIVKVDIEGGEVALFRSNVDWVAETPLIVFEAHDWLFHWRGTFHAIASVLLQSVRDYVQHNDTMFSFSHRLLAPEAADEQGVGRDGIEMRLHHRSLPL